MVFSNCVTHSGVLPGNTDTNHFTTHHPSLSIQKPSVSQTKTRPELWEPWTTRVLLMEWMVAAEMALKTRATERLAVFCSTKHRIQISPWGPRGKEGWHFRLACHSVNPGLLEDLAAQKRALCALTRLPSLLGYSVGADVSSRTASVAFILFSY